MEGNVQITMLWVYPSQAAELSVRAIKKNKPMADRMKRGEHRNIISDDELVWEHAGARLAGRCFLGKMQLVLGDGFGLQEERPV